MNCDDAQILLHGHLDGELELFRALELERHLADCPRCAPEYATLRALRGRVRDGALRYEAPAELRQAVRTALDEAAARRPRAASQKRRLNFGFAAAAGLAAAMLAAVVLMRTVPSPGDEIAQQAVASHVRSLMASHLLDVASTDQHTVKPWFDGKLDFSPPVTDFSSQGFPLIGGRLDYLGNRAVAALVYRRGKHVINVFVWPAAGAAPRTSRPPSQQGYNVDEMIFDGMHCFIVSDLNETELKQFAELLRGHK